jgi:formate dehydrogenase major subunit
MNTRNPEAAINRLTSSYHDRITHTPSYKEIGVRMEVLERTGEPPLPRWNHRFGNRTPQIGVRVEEKWKRDDYTPIPELIDGGFEHGQSDHAH